MGKKSKSITDSGKTTPRGRVVRRFNNKRIRDGDVLQDNSTKERREEIVSEGKSFVDRVADAVTSSGMLGDTKKKMAARRKKQEESI